MEVKYVRNPGFYYDLYRTMIMKMNHRAKWLDKIVNTGQESEDIQYVETQLKQFPELPIELSVFFCLRGRLDNSFFSVLYMRLLDQKQERLDLETFFSYLDDTEQVKSDVCRFYFGDKIDAENLAQITSCLDEDDRINNPKVKVQILSFFIRPMYYIGILREHLKIYISILDELYVKNEKMIIEKAENVNLALVNQTIEKIEGAPPIVYEDSYISFCVVNKNVVFKHDKLNWYILGWDYITTVTSEFDIPVDITKFGDAIGDDNRMRIMRHILENGEDTAINIGKQLGMSLSTIIYHVDRMEDAHLLSNYKKGRTTYYWLNVQHCAKIIDHIKSWIEMGGDRE